MGELIYCLVLLSCIVAAGRYFVPRYDRGFATTLLLCLLPIHVIVLYIANEAVPFVPSETDSFLYASESERVFTDISDVVNVSATATIVGPVFGGIAYTHLLTIVHQFAGDSLFFKKALNITSLWVVCFAWYAIALILGGKKLARWTALSCACLPTLWYFYCVVLRDLLTTAIDSTLMASALLFALGARRSYMHLSVMICALITSAFLRPATIYINIALLLVVFGATSHAMNRGKSWHIVALVLSGLAIGLVLRSETLDSAFSLGQKTSLDSLSAEADGATLEALSSPTGVLLRCAKAVPLFFASEPTIASKELQWGDPEQLRGVMNGVWFVLGTPFALVGVSLGIWSAIKNLLSRRSVKLRSSRLRRETHNIDKTVAGSRAALLIILLYCAAWFVVCVLAWDWTRWRLPVVPALCAIAVWGYRRIGVAGRCVSMAGWIVALCAWRMA
jgi:hypothetical protein